MLTVKGDTFTNWGPKTEYAIAGHLLFLVKICDLGFPFFYIQEEKLGRENGGISQRKMLTVAHQRHRDNTIMNKHQGNRKT